MIAVERDEFLHWILVISPVEFRQIRQVSLDRKVRDTHRKSQPDPFFLSTPTWQWTPTTTGCGIFVHIAWKPRPFAITSSTPRANWTQQLAVRSSNPFKRPPPGGAAFISVSFRRVGAISNSWRCSTLLTR